jgi:hypothetical protein
MHRAADFYLINDFGFHKASGCRDSFRQAYTEQRVGMEGTVPATTGATHSCLLCIKIQFQLRKLGFML